MIYIKFYSSGHIFEFSVIVCPWVWQILKHLTMKFERILAVFILKWSFYTEKYQIWRLNLYKQITEIMFCKFFPVIIWKSIFLMTDSEWLREPVQIIGFFVWICPGFIQFQIMFHHFFFIFYHLIFQGSILKLPFFWIFIRNLPGPRAIRLLKKPSTLVSDWQYSGNTILNYEKDKFE